MPAAPARSFHGWIMLVVAALMAAATMPGQTVIVSLFNASYRESLGLSITQLSAAYTIGTILAALPISWVGRLADRHGLRLVTGVVVIGFALSLVVLGQARGPLLLGGGFFLIRCLGQGCLSMLSGHVVAMWFERRLGMAHAVVMIGGMAVASAVLPQPVAWAITELGWRTTLLVLAGYVLVLTLPAVLTVFRNRPEDVGQRLDGEPDARGGHPREAAAPPAEDPGFTAREAVRTGAFWICTVSSLYSGLVGTALIFHMAPMLQTAGLEGGPREVALAIQAWPIALGISTLVVGWLVDRFRPAILLAVGTLLMGGATVLCLAASAGMVAPSSTVLLMGSGMAAFGASQAMISGVAAPTIARYFGRTHHGAIRGIVSSAMVASTGVGPLLAGVGYELAGQSFTVLLAVFAAITVPLTIAALRLRRPERSGSLSTGSGPA